jgi:4-hydroxybenzoate polyprenyltransferase
MRHGYGQYFMGTGFIYMLVSAISRINQAPYLLGSLAMIWGWIKSALQKKKRYDDLEFRAFLRRYQMRSLIVGKYRATAEALAAERQK